MRNCILLEKKALTDKIKNTTENGAMSKYTRIQLRMVQCLNILGQKETPGNL